jgi:hypothetical protein
MERKASVVIVEIVLLVFVMFSLEPTWNQESGFEAV